MVKWAVYFLHNHKILNHRKQTGNKTLQWCLYKNASPQQEIKQLWRFLTSGSRTWGLWYLCGSRFQDPNSEVQKSCMLTLSVHTCVAFRCLSCCLDPIIACCSTVASFGQQVADLSESSHLHPQSCLGVSGITRRPRGQGPVPRSRSINVGG